MYIIYEIKKICDELANAETIRRRKTILRREMNNTKWTDFLFYIRSPTTKGIGEFKLSNWTDYDTRTAIPFCTGYGNDLIEYLTYNNRGSKKDLFIIQSCIHSYPEDIQPFLYQALIKKVNIRVSVAVINEVYGKGFFPTIDYMKPDDYFDRDNILYIRGKQYVAMEKVGGMKCIAVKEHGAVQLYGEAGIPLANLSCIENEIARLPQNNIVLDGFILYNGKENLTYEERNKKTSSGMRSKSEIKTMTFWVYDYIALTDYRKKVGTQTYKERREILINMLEKGKYVKLVPSLYEGVARNVIKDLYNDAKAHQAGGIYLYLRFGYYTFHRSSACVELKTLYEIPLTIVDYVLQENSELLSYFIVDYNGVRVSVPLGYTVEERQKYGQDTYLYIGKKAIIQYCKEIIRQSDGVKTISSPAFLGIQGEERS